MGGPNGTNMNVVNAISLPPFLNMTRTYTMKVAMKGLLITIVSASLCLDALAATGCSKTTGAGAGRWDDTMKPSDRLLDMCRKHQTEYVASAGKMDLAFDGPVDCIGASAYAANQESHHGNWFLWNDIVCGNLKIHIF
jgi:hypothetical protein